MPVATLSDHTKAVLQALFVTFLWSTSWVLIKFGLEEIPALTFAGLRYVLAFVCLLPFALRPSVRAQIGSLTRREWVSLIVLGLLYYTVNASTQYLGLAYLPAVTVTLLLNFTSLLVAIFGIYFLNERPSLLQWIGVGLFLVGVSLYFYPADFPQKELIGLVIVIAGVFSNAISTLLGRQVNRKSHLHPLTVTLVSMGIGSAVLLFTGLGIEDWPALSLNGLAIIAWLAVVNTAFAFTLWNHTLRTLPAVESSIINNTMTVQIAILAWLFLDETLNGPRLLGLAIAVLGAFVVQRRPSAPVSEKAPAR